MGSYLTTSSGTNSPSFSVAPMYRWSPFINRRSSSLRRFIWQTEVKDPYSARVNRMLLSSNIKRYIQRKNRCIFKNLVRGRKIIFHELLTLTRSINYTCNRTKKSSALNIDQDRSSHQLLRTFWVSILRYMNFIVKYWLICEKKSRKHTREDGKRKWCFIYVWRFGQWFELFSRCSGGISANNSVMFSRTYCLQRRKNN